MDLALALEIAQGIEKFGELILKYGPGVLENAISTWNNLMLALKSALSPTPLSDAERKQIRVNLDIVDAKAKEKLDEAIAAVEAAQPDPAA